MTESQVIQTQPKNSSVQDGSVTVRNLQNTVEDTEFAGNLKVDAFEAKYEHAMGKNSVEKCRRVIAKEYQDQPQAFFDRMFVAEYNGERAGILMLKFYGDPKPRSNADNFSEFGCCDGRGWSYIENSIDAGYAEREGQCYLDHIGVDERFRGRGIGKVLMTSADQEARRLNCNEIFLWVAATNRAQNLYQRQGYEEVERSGCLCYCCMYCTTGEKDFVKMAKQL